VALSPAWVGTLLAVVLAVLAALHVGWAFGGRAPGAAVIPEVNGKPAFVPSRAATLLVALGLAAAATLALVEGGIVPLPLPPLLARGAALLLGLVFVARAVGEFRLVGFFKRVRGTAFATWDTWAFSPLSLAMGGAFLFLAAA
jgi:hypothetical protein